MTNETIAHELYLLDFTEGKRDDKGHYADLGTPVTGLIYLYRKHKEQYQYVSLCSYDGRFLEAIVYVYQNPFNSRVKVQQPLLHGLIYRNLNQLFEALEKTYELPKKAA